MEEDQKIYNYLRERNCQIFEYCDAGCRFQDIAEMFGLARSTIKMMYKKYRRTHPQEFRQVYQPEYKQSYLF